MKAPLCPLASRKIENRESESIGRRSVVLVRECCIREQIGTALRGVGGLHFGSPLFGRLACSDCLCNVSQWFSITEDCEILCKCVCVFTGGVTKPPVSCCISLMCLEQLKPRITRVCIQKTAALESKAVLCFP